MPSFAIYRLPFARQCTLMVQNTSPIELSSLADLNGQSGFVIAPFSSSDENPILLMHPDEITTVDVRDAEAGRWSSDRQLSSSKARAERESYHDNFAHFHSQLISGRFSKLVLSRCSETPLDDGLRADEIFQRACQLYPRQFVALFSTPKSGTWLMATPEILLDGSGGRWRTMALAGTMPYGEGPVSWSEKNQSEQRYVANYIRERLKDYAREIKEEGPQTTRAADLVHLRSDFTFFLNDDNAIGHLLDSLHPTPAVCGIPKDEARDYILDNESSPRHYYSGFAGPLNLQGDTHLYVSLRCMEILPRCCKLYAGGGILRESTEESEWEETEAKLSTMRKLLV